MPVGVYPGTFDPITYGHLDIIRRALKVVDRLIVAVAADTNKTTLFDQAARAAMVGDELARLPENERERVEVRAFAGLLVDFAREQHANVLVRGMRAVSDYEYEFQMACVNSKLAPEIETVFLTASESTHYISSRFVREVARLGGNISGFVSPQVAARLRDAV